MPEDLAELMVVAPVDSLQRFLLAHGPCVLAQSGAVVLRPVRGGICGLCCQCGASAVHLAVSGEWAPREWWAILSMGLFAEQADRFLAGGVEVSPDHDRCVEELHAAVRFCGWLYRTGQTGTIH